MSTVYPFTEQECQTAIVEWGCNCGPAALAFALRTKPEVARDLIEGFTEKGYTSPTMMAAALDKAGRGFDRMERRAWSEGPRFGVDLVPFSASLTRPVLTRIQWHGPWTAANANPRWAYAHTHWVCFFGPLLLFDINGGAMEWERWKSEIAPALTGMDKRRDGKFSFTHVWHLHSVLHAGGGA
jgi:hypothetical protein